MAHLFQSIARFTYMEAPYAFLWGAILLAFSTDFALAAETNAPTSPTLGEQGANTLETRLAEARAQLAAYNRAGLTNVPVGISVEEGWTRLAGLQRLVRLYEQQLSNAASLAKARTRKAEMARQAQAWTRFNEPPPYSILFIDRLREEIQAEREKIRNTEGTAAQLAQIIEENRGVLAETEGKLRQLNEQLETAKDTMLTARLSWQRDQERLRSQVAAVMLAVLDLERQIGAETLGGSRIHLGLLQRQLLLADAAATFTQGDLAVITARIALENEQVERELTEMQRRQFVARNGLEAAKEELRLLQSRPHEDPAETRARELALTREAQMDAIDTSIYILRLMGEGASVEGTMWQLRFAAVESRSTKTLRESERRLAVFMGRLELWGNYARQQSVGNSSELQVAESHVNHVLADSELLPLARERLQALRELELILTRFAARVERLQRLSHRWAEALRDAEDKLPLAGRVQNLFSDGSSFVQKLWSFEVFSAEDTVTVDGQQITGKRSVTIGKIVAAILILVAGYWITGLLTALIEPFIVKRLKIEPNQANLIRRWLRALLVVCLLLFSLVSVKIPLTVFAFAGGALAIGLGFGMQTVLKNFVSGLILLFERSFRVGDVLDINGQKGTITSIGLRASILHLWDGTETLIPNSSLLENNVTNWTYSNRKVRFAVSVGVAYGSDPRQVMELLSGIAEQHGLVEKEPKPLVLFNEFGDSTLSFELRFWVDVSKSNPAQVSSDLRLMIVGTFAEHGITIAFPQRDIHLRAVQPIQVEVVPAAETRGEHAGLAHKIEVAGKLEKTP